MIYRAIHLRPFDPRQVERCHLAIVQKLVETTDTRELPRSCLLSAVFVGEVGLVILDVGDIELLERLTHVLQKLGNVGPVGNCGMLAPAAAGRFKSSADSGRRVDPVVTYGRL
jgi:hypothetical protein